MCGIIGYVGPKTKSIKSILLDSLQRLEYRGYDSAGIAIHDSGVITVLKARGKLKQLAALAANVPLAGTLGIGHTRWATHGAPSDVNSHPHPSGDGKIAIVHNGIIENYIALREELRKTGYEFKSETDSEVLAHLVHSLYHGDLIAAVQGALRRLRGHYAVCVIHQDHPDTLIAAREQSPLIIGLGDKCHYVASDVPAILPYTKKIIYLDDRQLAVLKPDDLAVFDFDGRKVQPAVSEVDWSVSAAEKEGYAHFMLKEIFEQPRSLLSTLKHTAPGTPFGGKLDNSRLTPDFVRQLSRVIFVACGTAWHAGLVGKYLMEEYARIPAEAVMASEFRYGDPVIEAHTLVVAITQSGETADTLAGVRQARAMGAPVLSICNVVGSSIPRDSDEVYYMHCGPEIGVASTKAYTAMLATLGVLALQLGDLRGVLPFELARQLHQDLHKMPALAEQVLGNAKAIEAIAHKYAQYKDFMFIGRRYNYPTACEAALKLKEVTYFHAEGYPGGEMKHGPIALIDANFPTVAVLTQGKTYAKMVSNVEEIRARSGKVIAIATAGDKAVMRIADDVIYVPACPEAFSPILAVIPLQLFAYHIAVKNGRDVDQPRNLAKSVTVE